MAFVKKTWKDRISEYPTRRILEKTDGSSETVDVARSEGEVSQEGDAFSAENMNDLEERIVAGFLQVISFDPDTGELVTSCGTDLNGNGVKY